MVDVRDGFRAHDAAELLLGQFQQTITRRFVVKFDQSSMKTHFKRAATNDRSGTKLSSKVSQTGTQ